MPWVERLQVLLELPADLLWVLLLVQLVPQVEKVLYWPSFVPPIST
jgi:hypothetical protein